MESHETSIKQAAELFKAISDPGRLEIVTVLEKEPLSVTRLSIVLGREQSTLSHQLRILKKARIVVSRKEGKKRIYSLSDNHMHSIVRQVLSHVNEKREDL
ncbi:MAG: winged helix-turn-helix transcriptional regulator [Alkalibacterium sp.]|nr:winged helix-turn-helix transcriptional regulator [Alkalibacterium sp.]TVP90661.1 MAG: ArsR family transcriptional regulator [Alkalibacterium sp.]